MFNLSIRTFSFSAGAIAFVSALALQTHQAHAEMLPLWEAGMGVAAISLPNYRGADESSTLVLPAPYVVYRGDLIKADRNGLRGRIFSNEDIDLNLSANASLPVRSKNNLARLGMNDLKPTFEIGPSLALTLWRSPNKEVQLDFRNPLRAGFTVESHPKSIGWLYSPHLNLDVKNAFAPGWNLGVLAGPLFATTAYNRYFYSVSNANATTNRPGYEARGGYAGTQFITAVTKRFPNYWLGAFVRYDNLSKAAFIDSPLVKRQNAVSAGIAVSWIFDVSNTKVEAKE